MRNKTLQIIAYLVLAAACIFAVYVAQEANKQARANLAAGAKQAIIISCEADKATAQALRKALYGQKEFVRNNPEPPPPTTEQRLEALDELIKSIKIPDCEDRTELITEENRAEN
jgi:regulator of protease activity HflC (stomatin/prohibitin superfamily)